MGSCSRRVIRAAAFGLAAATWSGCSDGARPATTSVADSAGVRIVTSLPGSIEAAPSWSLSPEPVVEIGAGPSPAVALFRVSAVVPLDGGGVAVGTETPPHVLVFDADGGLAATLGREGKGPGEFQRVGSVVPLGLDSLAVWDADRRRISVYTVDGRFVREVDLSELVPLTPLAAGRLDGLTAFTYLLPSTSGSFFVFSVGLTGPELGVRRVEVPSYRITTAGDRIATLGPFPGEETFNFGRGKGGTFPYPFSASTFGATVGDGLVVGTAEAPELRLYDSAGALQRVVRWPDHDRTVAGPFLTDWQEFAEEWFSNSPNIRDALDRIPLPERFPAYDGLITAESGEIWVGGYAGEHTLVFPPRNLPPPPRRWLVFDADGALVAKLETPEGFQPYAVRDGRAWGVFRDGLEVESVRAHGIVKP